MRLTIQRRVFLAFFLLAAATLAILSVFIQRNLIEDFERYQAERDLGLVADGLSSRLRSLYDQTGDWSALRGDAPRWLGLLKPEDAPPPPPLREGGAFFPPPPPAFFPPPPGLPAANPGMGGAALSSPPHDLLHIHRRIGLLDEQGRCVVGTCQQEGIWVRRPLLAAGKRLGDLILRIEPLADSELETSFLQGQARYLLLASLVALVISLLAAWALARYLLQPVRMLAEASHRLAGGELAHRIELRRDDELGALAADFNVMAEQLARTEENRRQWIADSSHELRTPIAVLRAEIEALQDGVRLADEATLARLHHQTLRLGKLVDDLRQTLDGVPGQVAIARRPFDPLAVLKEVVESCLGRFSAAGLALELVGLERCACRMQGDAERLYQVFLNLLENSLRYTHAGGRLRICVECREGWLSVAFDDTPPAPPAEALGKLFDRFYRVESSRNRAQGGSGLGLAICKNLLTAQGGEIDAALSELGGLRIHLRLPVEVLKS